jgi:hypothetical protein
MITPTPGNKVLESPDGVPYDRVLHAFLDTRHVAVDSEGKPVGPTLGDPFDRCMIPVAVSMDVCDHSTAICNDCLQEWAIDYDFAELTVS